MPPAGTPTVTDLLRDLVRSRVLAEDRAGRLFGNAPPARKWDTIWFANHLVALGELTRFQADKLLRGHWQGLALGPYRLLCPLGRGGMGIVYLARSEAGGAPVALKVLPPARAKAEPRMLARFLREGETGRALPPHPNLTRTIAAGEYAGVYYLAMEYVPGKTVRQLVAEGGSLPVGQAARVFADVASGLHAAHAAGFVHRDLKPANVIVTPAGRAKLLDFGFALFRGESAGADPTVLGGPGHTLGTLDYLPPEQVTDAASVGPAADLYALGCSLYHAVAGCPPFPGGTPRDKIRWHRTDAAPPVTHFNPAIPAEFARLIAWLMAKRPGSRPASADEVALLLAPWADPVPAEPADPRTAPPAELLRQIEDRWQALKATATIAEDESLLILGDEDRAAAEARTPRPDRGAWLPKWLLPVVGAAVVVALTAAAAFGWLAGRFLTR